MARESHLLERSLLVQIGPYVSILVFPEASDEWDWEAGELFERFR